MIHPKNLYIGWNHGHYVTKIVSFFSLWKNSLLFFWCAWCSPPLKSVYKNRRSCSNGIRRICSIATTFLMFDLLQYCLDCPQVPWIHHWHYRHLPSKGPILQVGGWSASSAIDTHSCPFLTISKVALVLWREDLLPLFVMKEWETPIRFHNFRYELELPNLVNTNTIFGNMSTTMYLICIHIHTCNICFPFQARPAVRTGRLINIRMNYLAACSIKIAECIVHAQEDSPDYYSDKATRTTCITTCTMYNKGIRWSTSIVKRDDCIF